MKDTLYLSPDMHVPVHFGMSSSFEEPAPVKFFLEIPAGINVYSTSARIRGIEDIVRNGEPCRRHVFRGNSRSYYNWVSMYMDTGLEPGAGTDLYFYVEWEGGAQEPQRLPVESVKIDFCKAPAAGMICLMSPPLKLL